VSILQSISIPNPWPAIQPGQLPYVAPDDWPQVHAHNIRVANRYDPEKAAKYRLPLDVFPEPYLGHPDAPILLLNLNPGYNDESPRFHARPPIMDLCVANLRHEVSADIPFYPLHPRYLMNGGSRWWSLRLGEWIERFGKERVARTFFCIELFPYSSVSYSALPSLVPSQHYSIALAKAKLKAGCAVITMRAETRWKELLPGLEHAEHYRTNSRQNVYLTRNNLPAAAASRIERAMRIV